MYHIYVYDTHIIYMIIYVCTSLHIRRLWISEFWTKPHVSSPFSGILDLSGLQLLRPHQPLLELAQSGWLHPQKPQLGSTTEKRRNTNTTQWLDETDFTLWNQESARETRRRAFLAAAAWGVGEMHSFLCSQKATCEFVVWLSLSPLHGPQRPPFDDCDHLSFQSTSTLNIKPFATKRPCNKPF